MNAKTVMDTRKGRIYNFIGRVVMKAIIAAAIFNFICDILRIAGKA